MLLPRGCRIACTPRHGCGSAEAFRACPVSIAAGIPTRKPSNARFRGGIIKDRPASAGARACPDVQAFDDESRGLARLPVEVVVAEMDERRVGSQRDPGARMFCRAEHEIDVVTQSDTEARGGDLGRDPGAAAL